LKIMDEYIVTIICPECGKVQDAKVIVDVPFNIYIHTCNECGYLILESEWNRVELNGKD